MDLDAQDIEQLDALVGHRVTLRKGESLYRNHDPAKGLYAVRVGSLKRTVLAEDGREQVAGFHMLGDVVGLDGVGPGRYSCNAIALEDTELCVHPLERLAELAHAAPHFQRNLHLLLSHEISRDHHIMLLLGSMHAEERLAAFLLNLADRYRRRGYSSTEFVLRMTRDEIGSHLGLELETVSRLFSRFHVDGLIQIQGRDVKILNSAALREVIGHRG